MLSLLDNLVGVSFKFGLKYKLVIDKESAVPLDILHNVLQCELFRLDIRSHREVYYDYLVRT